MNIFGIGNMELVIVLIVALLVLGPARMVDAARSVGKFWAEAQRTLRGVADAATAKLDEPPPSKPAPPPPQPEGAVARDAADGEEPKEPRG